MKKLIQIQGITIASEGNRTRVVGTICYDGQMRTLWFEVPTEYGKYLCHERGDAFVVGLLPIAMRDHMDIQCDVPVTDELLYQIRTYLIPSIAKHSTVLSAPVIDAPIAEGALDNIGAVGTGLSCGVDSLHAIATHTKSPYSRMNITHLTLFNDGAFWKGDVQFSWQLNQARKFCADYGYKLIETNSNLSEAFHTVHLYAHTYSDVFMVLLLQKFWGAYYYASTGHDFSEFSIDDFATRKSCGSYDLLSLDCFSTRKLRFYSVGGAETRFEKVKLLLDYPPAWKYLNCCIQVDGGNCSVCEKCKRTLLILDALGAVDRFKGVFDVEHYRLHRKEYLQWLLRQKWVEGGDSMLREALESLGRTIPICIILRDKLSHLKYSAKKSVKRILGL